MANKVLVTYGGANVWIASLARGQNLRLLPGVNAVDATEWSQFAEKNSVVKSLMAAGTIKVVRESIPVPAPDPESAQASDDRAHLLDGLKDKDAVALVEETYDVTLLAAWRDSAKSRKVQAAVAKQLDEINGNKEGSESQE